MCKREKAQEKKSCYSTRNSTSLSINVFEGSKKALNFNEKKNLNQMLFGQETDVEKLISNRTTAPNKFFALNPMLQLELKSTKVKCLNRDP